jgi:hypothetical protein
VTLVDQHPLVQAADQALEALQQKRNQFETRVAALAAEDLKELQVYEEALGKALLEGGPAPTPPVRRLPEGADVEPRHDFMRQQQRLTEERRRAVAAAYDDVLRQARSALPKLLKAARSTVEQLVAQAGPVSELMTAVQVCRDARNVDHPEGRREYHDSRFTVDEYIRLVATGGDPISEILDLTGGPQEKLRSGRTGMTLGDLQQLINPVGNP